MLLRAAAKEYGWNLNMGGIALMWRGGCIIRSQFLGKIKDAFKKNKNLDNLLLDKFFSRLVNKYQASWRKALVHAVEAGRAHAGVFNRAGILRWLSCRTAAGESAAGAARLLWRAHLRARRPAARAVLPHELDGAWRAGFVEHVYGVKNRSQGSGIERRIPLTEFAVLVCCGEMPTRANALQFTTKAGFLICICRATHRR